MGLNAFGWFDAISLGWYLQVAKLVRIRKKMISRGNCFRLNICETSSRHPHYLSAIRRVGLYAFPGPDSLVHELALTFSSRRMV